MRSRRRVAALVIFILILAAGLRLTRLGLIEFKYDEATTARNALAVARGRDLPMVGMVSSQGPRNPALMSYVLAPPFILSRDPRWAAGWLALLGVGAVGLTYWIGQAYFDWRVGAVASLLFAASPWAVFQSRKIWTQNLPLFTLLFIAATLTLTVRRKRWALAGALAIAGCLVSLHLGGLAFFFILAVLLALFREQIRPGPLLMGIVLLALIVSPYLIHDARHGWPNLRAFADMADGGTALNLKAPRMAALITGGYHLEDLAGTRHAEFVASILDLRWLDWIEIVLLWTGLAWMILQVGREALLHRGRLSRRRAAQLVLLCWFIVPVALLMRRDAPVHPHDFNLLYPAHHFIVALLLVDVVKWGKRNGSRLVLYASAIFVILLVAWQVYFQQSLLTFVDTHETPGGYGAPIKYALAASRRAETLASTTKPEAAELIALLPGADPRYDGNATAFDVLLKEEKHRLVDGTQALVLPNRPTIYLVHPQAEAALSLLPEEAESVSSLPLRGGSDEVYRLFRRQPVVVEPAHSWKGNLRRWTSGVLLLGYDWSGEVRPGGTIRWTLTWRVEGPPPAENEIHWFNHLIDTEGVRQGQKDGTGLPASKWRIGDTVLTWFDISIDAQAPPPPYFVRCGMYIYPDIANVSLVNAEGYPVGSFVELGPIDATP